MDTAHDEQVRETVIAPPASDFSRRPLKGRALERGAGDAAAIAAGRSTAPPIMVPAFDIDFDRLPFVVEGAELLLVGG